VREQNDVANRRLIGNDGGEAVDPQSHAPGRGESVLERGEEVLVHRMGLIIPGRPGTRLVDEAAALVIRIV